MNTNYVTICFLVKEKLENFCTHDRGWMIYFSLEDQSDLSHQKRTNTKTNIIIGLNNQTFNSTYLNAHKYIYVENFCLLRVSGKNAFRSVTLLPGANPPEK